MKDQLLFDKVIRNSLEIVREDKLGLRWRGYTSYEKGL